jgi:hypothetical protein
MILYRGSEFLACHDCGVMQPVAVFVGNGHDDGVAEAAAAWSDFAVTHSSHRTAHVVRHGSETHADRQLWDPMSTIRFEVTDGEHVYVVSATRSSIEEPRLYRFVPGTLEVRSSEVALEDEDLRRGLDMEFYPHAIRPSKLDRFLSLVHDMVRHINPEDLAIAFDAADDPSVSIARMPEAVYGELLTRCQDIFDDYELSKVSRFLEDNRNEDGLLVLRVRREIRTVSA